jgi:carbonic anhydrase/acetyltransferase-like protein (isoleucine patch superfamily)
MIGDDVTIYQGVTLGGTGKDTGKRHPTIGNDVVIGAGAKVLGNITVGENSRIGAGSVILRSVPDNSTVLGVPGHIVFRDGKRVVITDPRQITDPLAEALAVVATQVIELKEKLQNLEGVQLETQETKAPSPRRRRKCSSGAEVRQRHAGFHTGSASSSLALRRQPLRSSSSVISRERRVLVRNLSFFSSAPTRTLRFFSP